jgi:prepilin-type N-terminal cleavage/methylation domain-containing protein
MDRRELRGGFPLIEMVVVLPVVGMTAAVAAPALDAQPTLLTRQTVR